MTHLSTRSRIVRLPPHLVWPSTASLQTSPLRTTEPFRRRQQRRGRNRSRRKRQRTRAQFKHDKAKRRGCNQTWKCVNPRCSSELRGAKLGKAGTVARCELCGKFETIKNAERHRCRGFHISHDLQLLIDSGDADALAALSDHTADTDGWDDEFLPGYASGASDDGDLF